MCPVDGFLNYLFQLKHEGKSFPAPKHQPWEAYSRRGSRWKWGVSFRLRPHYRLPWQFIFDVDYTLGVLSVDVYSVIDVSEVRAVSIFRVLSNITWDLKDTDTGFHDSLLLILITLFGFDLGVAVDSRAYVSEVKSGSIFRICLCIRNLSY